MNLDDLIRKGLLKRGSQIGKPSPRPPAPVPRHGEPEDPLRDAPPVPSTPPVPSAPPASFEPLAPPAPQGAPSAVLRPTLRDRLARLERVGDSGTASPRRVPIVPRADIRRAACAGRGDVASLLGGYYPEGLECRVMIREEAYPIEAARGGRPLTVWFDDADRVLPLFRDTTFRDGVTMHDALYFDLETTGLAGGSGTIPFLIGIARVEGDSFVVRQFFLEDLSAEDAMLEAVLPYFEAAALLVSFNGKSYDGPLLETRLTLCHLDRGVLRRPHLDLLHAARTFYKGVVAGCSLRELESFLFGHERHDDIPGALIPQAYFAFQREGDASPLPLILNHNRDDLVNMPLVAGSIGRAYADRDHGGCASHRVGKHLLRKVSRVEGEAWLSEAVGDARDPESRYRAMEALASSRKACGAYDEAARLYREMADLLPEAAAKPLVELSKYHEHRKKEYAVALTCLDKALALCDGFDDPALLHRRARLLRKLGEIVNGADPV